MNLTEKQNRFVDYYIETGNKTKAAKKAGYSEKRAAEIGAENYRKPHIRAAIDARMAEMGAKRVASADEVVQFFTTVMRGELEEEVVTNEGTGDGRSSTTIVKKHASAHDRLDAAKQLARRYGLDKLVIEQKLEDRVQFIEPPEEASDAND